MQVRALERYIILNTDIKAATRLLHLLKYPRFSESQTMQKNQRDQVSGQR